ncbi:unnamed protein product [Rhizoctonia solani]|uniref:DUF6535 domain-containing protein n=1 Tax=Rhizoctonia solani TaxID=456999 RepID=A0A8H3AD01_9AGAM|nr:unnamed protein product [Rhizoctonia solani]
MGQQATRPSSSLEKTSVTKETEARAPDLTGDDDPISKSILWDYYQDEAKAQDQELVNGREKNLDTMLIFAGIFSAVLTAFLANSTSLLGPDQADISIKLLLSIAQSQQRIESGIPNSSLSPVTIPQFNPSASARWINILWFLSLVLSLGAAMVAMLAKEWLNWFVIYRTAAPRRFSLERQNRFEGLQWWRAVGLVDFIPTILHVSLLLFILGLIVRLWIIDRIVASVVTAVSAAFALFYVGTVLFGALYEPCPFKARMSKYIQMLGQLLSSPFKAEHDEEKDNEDQTSWHLTSWHALQWFLDHARDPADANKVYQNVVAADPRSCSYVEALLRPQRPTEMILYPERYLKVLKLGTQAIKDIKAASKRSIKCLLRNGFHYNLARHAAILSDVYPYAYAIHPRPCGLESNLSSKQKALDAAAHEVCTNAFEALEYCWSHEKPPVIPSDFAGLTTAMLNLSSHAIRNSEIRGNTGDSTDHTTIEMSDSDLNRFIAALQRASVLLYSHITQPQRVPLEESTLVGLLVALQHCRHLPKSRLPSQPSIQIKLAGATRDYKFKPGEVDQKHGLLTGLLSLLGNTNLSAKALDAALDAMADVAPLLIRQWLLNTGAEVDSIADLNLRNHSEAESTLSTSKRIVLQLKLFMEQTDQYWVSPGIQELSFPIASVLLNQLSASQKENEFINIISKYPQLLSSWIKWVEQNLLKEDDRSKIDWDPHKTFWSIWRIFFNIPKTKARNIILDSKSLIGLMGLIEFYCKYDPTTDIQECRNLLKDIWPKIYTIMVHQDPHLYEDTKVYSHFENAMGHLKQYYLKIKGGGTNVTNPQELGSQLKEFQAIEPQLEEAAIFDKAWELWEKRSSNTENRS